MSSSVSPAIELFRAALRSQSSGSHAQAEALYRQVLDADAGNADAWNNLGTVLKAQGRLTEAVAAARRAVGLRPAFAEAHTNLGNALKAEGRLDDAVRSYRAALDLKPDLLAAHFNLANTLKSLGRLHDALAEYRKIVAISPEFPGGHNNLGRALEESGQTAEALECYRRAVRLAPDSAGFHTNVGNVLRDLCRIDEAVAAQRRALALDPGFHDARFNLACALLVAGDFENGWPAFEARRFTPTFHCATTYRGPVWDGADLAGRTILLDAEQGYGDAIHFARYIPLVAARGGRPVFRCHRGLHRLLTGRCQIAALVAPDETPPHFDAYCPLPSLPGIFRTTLDTIPSQVPYLHAEPALKEKWHDRLAAEIPLGARRVGLAWAGNPLHLNDRNRSVPPAALSILARVPGVQFVNVQKSPNPRHPVPAPPGLPLLDLTHQIADFADTAALLANLDLLVTADTAVAHLAGAMNVPVWLLLPFAPDWRWLLARDRSPWYPSMRLFRQPSPGDWRAPIRRIRRELARRTNTEWF